MKRDVLSVIEKSKRFPKLHVSSMNEVSTVTSHKPETMGKTLAIHFFRKDNNNLFLRTHQI